MASYAQRELFKAVKNCEVPLVEEILKEHNVDLNFCIRAKKWTLLHVNAVNGNSIITRHLVRAGCMINRTDVHHNTALNLAIKNGHFEVACELVELGADVHIKDHRGETPLQSAVMAVSPKTKDCLKLINILLKAKADVNTNDDSGWAPIHYAATTGDLEFLGELIFAGADVNVQSISGKTALFYAIDICHEAIVHILLKNGANVAVQDPETGCTPLDCAVGYNDKNSHDSIIKMLVEFGADINETSEEGWTPFHEMVVSCNHNTLSSCIHKVDMRQQSLAPATLLHSAVLNPDPKVMHLLLEKGIPIDAEDEEIGDTPLIIASKMMRAEHASELISRGANVHAKNKSGQTPLLLSVLGTIYVEGENMNPEITAKGGRKVIRLLLEAECDLNQKIAYRGMQTVVEVLINDRNGSSLTNMIIQHAAKVEAMTNRPQFDEYNMMLINADPVVANCYAFCRTVLEEMKNTIGNTSVSYLSILREPLDLVVNYARNEEIVRILESGDFQDTYPIYGSQVYERFYEARCICVKKEKVLTVLSEALPLANPLNPILENIFKYLGQTDIDQIVGSELMEI